VANGGRILVTREAEGDPDSDKAAARQVVETFEPVAGPEAVQTPKQVGAGMGVLQGGGSYPCLPGLRARQ